MLYIPLGLYYTRSEYPGRSPIVLVCVNPVLQWTRRYFPLGASLIFESYFSLMNVLHVDWLSRRHQFSSITASAEADRMVSPTCIILELPFITLVLIVSVCGTSCVEVSHKMRPGYGSSPHYSVGAPIMRLYKASLTFTNAYWYPLPGSSLEYFYCFILLNYSESSFRLA